LGERILRYREFQGLNQKALAKGIGVDPGILERWEGGKSRPKKEQLKKPINFFSAIFWIYNKIVNNPNAI